MVHRLAAAATLLASTLSLASSAPSSSSSSSDDSSSPFGAGKWEQAQLGSQAVAAESSRLLAKYGRAEEALHVNFAAGLLAPEKRQLAKKGLGKRQGGRTADVPLLCWITSIDFGYTADALVGTPSQEFQILPDTGSSDLWLNAPGSRNFDKSFDPTTSTSFRDTSAVLNISYNRGSFIGDIGTDIVSMGGLSQSNTSIGVGTVDRQNFGAVGLEGLMGFAFSIISRSRAPTYFDSLIRSGQLAEPSAGFFIARGVENGGGKGSRNLTGVPGGIMTLGGTNGQFYTGELREYKLMREQHWTIQMDGWVINGQLIAGTRAPAAIDTGTSLVQVPDFMLSNIVNVFGNQATVINNQLYIVCDAVPSYWGLSFGGQIFEFAMADLITDVSITQRTGIAVCGMAITGGQQAADVNPTTGVRDAPLAVVGSAFLKNWYSVYTMPTRNSAATVAFARANPPSNATLQDVINVKLGRLNAYPTGTSQRGNGTGATNEGTVNVGAVNGASSAAGRTVVGVKTMTMAVGLAAVGLAMVM